MNLADMLSFADIGQLTRIATHYECECNENSKHELIQSILTKVSGRQFFEHQVRRLSVEELHFLNSILFDSRSFFSLEELVACVQQSKLIRNVHEDENPRETVLKFKQRGWIFNGTTRDTRYLYQVPIDLKNRFREVIEGYLKTNLQFGTVPSVYREEHSLLSEDLLLFLKYVHQYEIPLNNEGVMYRRNQQQIMESLHVTEPLVGKGGWRFGYGRRYKDYPTRFALLYDYAFHNRLIEERGAQLILTERGTEHVLESRQEPMTQIFRFWLRLYRGPIPNMTSLIYWIHSCAKEWVTVSSLYGAVGSLIRPFFYDTPESIFEHRLLLMLMHLGMLRVGEGNIEGKMIQVTPLGSSLVKDAVHV
ncbi:hypothetical protein PASE110613_01310 [Paenibacillus sediminis]|uniref:Helicase XPB/Ssl2 N-terminal domain-containing protein n=1 Tax=Paenibacillus sediminis TaxID=664909 RepID=A0ABS4GZS6_9BACL|nr:hypothetical protein [Paenibacillus sediminis]MBP1935779.1 hypothetical protein [Paenibacillus sediminis]